MRILFFCLLMLTALASKAQFKLEDVVKPGTKLVYEVEANGKTYNFIVTVKDLKGNSFDWEMADPVNTKGTIQHTTKGLEDGVILHNFFSPGPKKLDDKTTSVWLSKKVWTAFTSSAGKPVKMYWYGPDQAPQEVGSYTGDLPYELLVDGKETQVDVALVKPLVKSGKDYIPSASDDFMHVSTSAKVPIILAMRLNFSIRLKEIKTK